MSKLQFGSVPQDVKGFNWYVEKVTFGAAAGHGVMQGIVWAIPKEMCEDLGTAHGQPGRQLCPDRLGRSERVGTRASFHVGPRGRLRRR